MMYVQDYDDYYPLSVYPVFNATGVRVRDFPITIEKLLPGLPLLNA